MDSRLSLHKIDSIDNRINIIVNIFPQFLFLKSCHVSQNVVKWTHLIITIYGTNLTPYVYVLCEVQNSTLANIIMVHTLNLYGL